MQDTPIMHQRRCSAIARGYALRANPRWLLWHSAAQLPQSAAQTLYFLDAQAVHGALLLKALARLQFQ